MVPRPILGETLAHGATHTPLNAGAHGMAHVGTTYASPNAGTHGVAHVGKSTTQGETHVGTTVDALEASPQGDRPSAGSMGPEVTNQNSPLIVIPVNDPTTTALL